MVHLPSRNLPMPKTYPTVLRCYARPEGDQYIGQCLELDLAVQGRSLAEVHQKMEECLESYLQSLDAQNVPDCFPRPAPLHVWLDYARVRLLVALSQVLHQFGQHVAIFHERILPQQLALQRVG